MNICVVGTGYVGLVTGTCFAEFGNPVTCVDKVADKIESLQRGEIPIYEPGLDEIVSRNVRGGRLSFTSNSADAIDRSLVIFIAVGTPAAPDGSTDLASIEAVSREIGQYTTSYKVIVTKSTVPVGTSDKIRGWVQEELDRRGDGTQFSVASNPEFLREGAALSDFMRPDRVVLGVKCERAETLLRALYRPLNLIETPIVVTDLESAELTKYASNAFLATKISFINEMANLCERMGGDINDVRRGIGHDSCLGFAFLFPGVGYGGSCFPKDVRALAAMAASYELEPHMLTAVDRVNDCQKQVMIEKIGQHFDGDLAGKTIAVWGLAFKPRTDDIREAPALVLIDHLLKKGTRLQVHDPEALANVRALYGDKLVYCERRAEALDNADALVIMTEWKDYHRPNWEEMLSVMHSPTVFDGRNLYEPERMRELGFRYYSMGRPAV